MADTIIKTCDEENRIDPMRFKFQKRCPDEPYYLPFVQRVLDRQEALLHMRPAQTCILQYT